MNSRYNSQPTGTLTNYISTFRVGKKPTSISQADTRLSSGTPYTFKINDISIINKGKVRNLFFKS